MTRSSAVGIALFVFSLVGSAASGQAGTDTTTRNTPMPPATQPATRPATQPTAELVADNTFTLHIEGGRLAGPGGERLVREAASAQFLIFAEPHNNRDLPRIMLAAFRSLHEAYRFEYLALEQDPLSMERFSDEPLRGNLDRIADFVRTYPLAVTFSTDEELKMIAEAGRISTGRWRPIWGAEQAFGATHYLEELKTLAPDERAAAMVDGLLQEARSLEVHPRTFDNPFTGGKALENRANFAALREAFASRPGTRSERLLDYLISSTEIYAWYHRGVAGEPDTGLANATAREADMRRRFIGEYRLAEAADRRPPKVLLKYGAWHVRRGRSPGQVFNLGAFVHEVAELNGMTAIGVNTVAFARPGEHSVYSPWDELPAHLRALAPAGAPAEWTLVNLRPIRQRWASGERFGIADAAELTQFREMILGFEYVLYLPGSDWSELTMIRGESQP